MHPGEKAQWRKAQCRKAPPSSPAKLPLLQPDATDPANPEWIGLFGKINPLVGKVQLEKKRVQNLVI